MICLSRGLLRISFHSDLRIFNLDILLRLHGSLQPLVDFLHVRPLAQRLFRHLLTWRYGNEGLSTTWQNDRRWKLDPEVALRGSFQEFETVKWLRKLVRPGMSVVDIGANVGQMTLEMAELVGPSGRVIAIEPAPGNLTLLRRHVRANGFNDRVEIVPVACGRFDDSEQQFRIFGDDVDSVGSGHSFVSEHGRSKNERELESIVLSVRTMSLNRICRELNVRPAVIKIDVEGAELQVLEGASQTLRECRPAVRFAFHPMAFPDPAVASDLLRELMRENGYRVENDGPLLSFSSGEYNALPDS
jgi:FkbM family methyltransferase